MDHYSALEVPAPAPHEEVRKAYHRLSLLLHPDKQASATPAAASATAARFQRVQAAWEVLGDAARRAEYDAVRQTSAVRSANAADVDLDDCEFEEATATYFYPCRCGERYEVGEEELEVGVDTVQCVNCSLSIRLLYTDDGGDADAADGDAS